MDSVEGQRARPSAVARFDLLNVVGSRPARRASPEGVNPARAARRSMADQTCACVSIDTPERGGCETRQLHNNSSDLKAKVPVFEVPVFQAKHDLANHRLASRSACLR